MKNVITYIAAAVLALSIVGAPTALPADQTDEAESLRCGSELVTVGDRKLAVAEKCGEPDRIQIRSSITEVWTYNFGPRRFMRYLTFVNGELRRIQVGDYGW